ncbi:putative hydroxymethyltransferase [Annulohypoxylon truncatum]|uniref:putative hydroxymethyltransferase n=1 Tax=Annulohypoxylon truncatum TaxID=327061 RepID=UPI0020081C22|nr:putative hydroxymethyltransferase [Annulohypoxylon truncatum]KAI1204587.1 putative hydroxymethyltransferase [Annulohypoxylon truncatum]
MSQKIICDASVGSGAGQWYGTLVIKNIRYEDGSSVTIQSFLGVKFLAPKTTADITVNAQFTPWQEVSSEISTEELDQNTIDVTAKVFVQQAHTFVASDTITWGINADLTVNPDTYTNSFELYADALPGGTVNIEVAAAPDSALADTEQVVYLEKGTQATPLTATPGETESYQVAAGTYNVEAAELANSDETVVATALVSPSQVEVQVGAESAVSVTYGVVQKYSALDVSIGSLSSPIDKEPLHVKVVDNSTATVIDEFLSSNNRTTNLRRLPASGSVDVSAQITLNNVKYSAVKTVQLSGSLIQVSVGQSDIKTENIDTTGFVDLPVQVQTDLTGSSGTISVRLTSANKDLIYTQQLSVGSASSKFDVKVAPGDYTVKATGFIQDSTVYAIQAPAALTVNSDGSTVLQLATQKGADLNVNGFTDFLTFGGLSDLVDLEGTDFVAANAFSLFKYAGNDGAGDAGTYLADDPATTKTVQLADTVADKLGHSVLPVMISYTVNLSLGDTLAQLNNKEGLAHSFGNLILSMNLAQSTSKQTVPIGYVVNPDFLGECQKGPSGQALSPDYSMAVREPLADALQYRKVDADIPDDVTDTLKGYVVAVNWLIRTVCPRATFGWQANIWGVGSSTWIYTKDASADGPAQMAKKTADYIKSLEVYSGKYVPDFLAIDRYEADDFTQRAYTNGYCYGPYEWGRFFDFCGALSLELQVPVMPWQIPASRIPARTESVVDLEVEHWGSGGTYIFGDANIGSDYLNIHPKILEIKPAPLVTHPTVEDLFASAQPFDLSDPAYFDFPLRGIFAVLLGGGATTGIVTTIGKTAKWTQEKTSAYMEDPVSW